MTGLTVPILSDGLGKIEFVVTPDSASTVALQKASREFISTHVSPRVQQLCQNAGHHAGRYSSALGHHLYELSDAYASPLSKFIKTTPREIFLSALLCVFLAVFVHYRPDKTFTLSASAWKRRYQTPPRLGPVSVPTMTSTFRAHDCAVISLTAPVADPVAPYTVGFAIPIFLYNPLILTLTLNLHSSKSISMVSSVSFTYLPITFNILINSSAPLAFVLSIPIADYFFPHDSMLRLRGLNFVITPIDYFNLQNEDGSTATVSAATVQ